ncbi:hypothetical protein B0T10DRAFT_217964 [Thelonectria olida]|uniref:Secreted protein n=1 Tax=Thelonectria olida TaxID=1576542 RepID=A0A9P8WEC9_9HYPO|nr:hypothetical protein B0T10DRAFT_217964 [Thelonectria olida]
MRLSISIHVLEICTLGLLLPAIPCPCLGLGRAYFVHMYVCRYVCTCVVNTVLGARPRHIDLHTVIPSYAHLHNCIVLGLWAAGPAFGRQDPLNNPSPFCLPGGLSSARGPSRCITRLLQDLYEACKCHHGRHPLTLLCRAGGLFFSPSRAIVFVLMPVPARQPCGL